MPAVLNFVVSVLREDKISESIQTVLYKTIMKMVNSSYFFHIHTFFDINILMVVVIIFILYDVSILISMIEFGHADLENCLLTPGFFQICFLGKFKS